jgi:hypothetical protein
MTMTGKKNSSTQVARRREFERFDIRSFPRYVPDKLAVTLRTSFTLSYALAVGNTYYLTQIVNANDVRTPITGQQAMFRDQLYTIWLNARCYGFRITVHATCTTAGQAPRLLLGPASSGVADASLDMSIERKGAKHGYVIIGAPPRTFTMSSGVTDFLGMPPSSIDDTTFLQPVGSDLAATQVAYVQINASNVVLAATANVYAEVLLEQFVVFQDLAQAADS